MLNLTMSDFLSDPEAYLKNAAGNMEDYAGRAQTRNLTKIKPPPVWNTGSDKILRNRNNGGK